MGDTVSRSLQQSKVVGQSPSVADLETVLVLRISSAEIHVPCLRELANARTASRHMAERWQGAS